MGSCQNYGPFLGTLNSRGRIIIGIQKGTIILTTTPMKRTWGRNLFHSRKRVLQAQVLCNLAFTSTITITSIFSILITITLTTDYLLSTICYQYLRFP